MFFLDHVLWVVVKLFRSLHEYQQYPPNLKYAHCLQVLYQFRLNKKSLMLALFSNRSEHVYSLKVMCIFLQCFYSLNSCFDTSQFFKWPGIFWIEIILLFQVTTTDILIQRGIHKKVVYFSSVFWYMHLDCSWKVLRFWWCRTLNTLHT